MAFLAELGTFKPVIREFSLTVGHIFATENAKRQHLRGRQVGGESAVVVFSCGLSKQVNVPLLHRVVNFYTLIGHRIISGIEYLKFAKQLLAGCLVVHLSGLAYAQNRWADELTMAEKIEMGKPYHGEYAEIVEPFTVVANIHSIGARDIGVYLITTGEGHILMDSGTPEMHEGLKSNIERLGFKISDIEIILSTHAHFDHVQGHESMRALTGAQVMAVGLDSEALRLGKDLSPLGFEGWEPVKEVTTLKHGDTIELGGVVLTAHQIPGHTQGCTVWTMTANDEGREINLAFFGCRGPNGIVKIIGNEAFPDLIEQSLMGYERLNAISPDIYLDNHPARQFEGRVEAMKAGERPHPLTELRPWSEMVADLEHRFRLRLGE